MNIFYSLNILFIILINKIFCDILCDDNLKNIEIFTYFKHKNITKNYSIFKNCEIDKYFDNFYTKNNIYEGISIINRTFLFNYKNNDINNNNQKYKFYLNYSIEDNFNNIELNTNNFILNSNELKIVNLFYQCNNNNNNLNQNYFKINLHFHITNLYDNNENNFSIIFYKYCNSITLTKDNSIDVCHIILILIAIIIIYFSNGQYFQTNFEMTVLKQFPETRTEKYLYIYMLLIPLILFLFNLIYLLNFFINIIIIIVCLISISLILEVILKNFDFFRNLKNRYLENNYISINFLFLYNLSVSFIIWLIYNITKNFILNDIISISIIFEFIRLFQFTSFKFLFFFSLIIWLYLLLNIYLNPSIIYIANKYGIILKEFINNFPVLIIFPKLYYNNNKIFNINNSDNVKYLIVPMYEIILPGILINYFYRLDKYFNLYELYFFYISFSSFIVGILIKIIFSMNFFINISSFIFTFPLIIISNYIYAYYSNKLEKFVNGFNPNIFAENEMPSSNLFQIANNIYGESHGTITSSFEMKNFK